MNETAFRAWLQPQIHPKTIGDYVSDLKRIERYYGDLDQLYDTDRMAPLLDELTCSPTEVPRHRIPIGGDARSVTSTLRSAARRYKGFRDAQSEWTPNSR